MSGPCELQTGRGANHTMATMITIMPWTEHSSDTFGKILRHLWQIHHCQSKENNVGFGATGCRKQVITMVLESSILSTMGIFERNEYLPHGHELVPYENTFMRIWNEFIPTLCWNLHKPKPPKIKTFLMEKGS